MSEVLEIEVILKIYEHYRGLQVTFPTRLLSKEYVKQQVKLEFNGTNIKKLALKYSYSERWIRDMIDEKDQDI